MPQLQKQQAPPLGGGGHGAPAPGGPVHRRPFSGGWVSYLYDNDVLPTDKLVLVRWSDYDRAKELSSQVRRQVEAERAAVGQEEEGETFEDMPRKKRILVQVVSVLAFILLIMAAVYGADFAANWLKGLWS